MEILPVKTEILKCNFNLLKILEEKLSGRVKNGDVLLLSSKLIALAEGRVVDLRKIKPSKKALQLNESQFRTTDSRLIELILQESDLILPGKIPATLKNNIFTYAAGIDCSNAPEDHAILWPRNAEKTARALRQKLCKKFRLKNFGVVIGDSNCQPLRFGTAGVALAWAGFLGVEDLRGKKDIFGRVLRMTQTNIADSLASAAVLEMGEGNERRPLAVIERPPIAYADTVLSDELFIDAADDMYRSLFASSGRGKRG